MTTSLFVTRIVLPATPPLGHARRLLIEFAEMTAPSSRSKRNVEAIDAALRRAGYACLYFDGGSNFLYARG